MISDTVICGLNNPKELGQSDCNSPPPYVAPGGFCGTFLALLRYLMLY